MEDCGVLVTGRGGGGGRGTKRVDKAVWAVGGKAGAGVTKQNPSRTWEALPFLLVLELGAILISMKTARESLDEFLVV